MSSRLSDRRFRRSRVFRVVPIGELTPDDLTRLGLIQPNDVAAVLLPTKEGFSAKAICANTMRLLEALEVPATLSMVLSIQLRDAPNLLAQLVLDSALEVEHDGQFLSGAGVAEMLGVQQLSLDQLSDAVDATGPSGISAEALHYGEQLPIDDASELSARMYYYNRIPASAAWTSRLGSAARLEAWLGLAQGLPLRQALGTSWIEVPPALENPAWWHFRSRRHYTARSPFKLYVCPHTTLLPEVLAEVSAVFEECGLSAFKVGRDLLAVLRSDKLIAYSETRARLDRAAAELQRRLRGVPVQVVPFTAPLDAAGLLSWGMDPPISEQLSTWQGTSWRRWVTDRLAVALIAARTAGVSSTFGFALRRIALEGVDVGSWTPAKVSWA
ncbi:MAG TPA: hypothetical protein VJV79_31730 [Polyangiaceae bacterium]|nr:hypothetical protein [Polyangiaceae bacterium]